MSLDKYFSIIIIIIIGHSEHSKPKCTERSCLLDLIIWFVSDAKVQMKWEIEIQFSQSLFCIASDGHIDDFIDVTVMTLK